MIRILKKVSDSDSPDAFAAVYHQDDPGRGIGGFDLSNGGDRLFAFDYGGTGKLDHLVCYRPGTGTIWILKKVSNNDSPDAFLPVYPTNAVLPVYATLTAKISGLFAALPDQNFNVAGNAARAALVNHLKGCTSGKFGFDARGAGGSLYTFSFRDQFFYGFAPDPNAGYITPTTGLGDDWWTAFNVVVICQAIYYVTSNTRNAVRQPDVNNQVAALNGALQSAHVNFFSMPVFSPKRSAPGYKPSSRRSPRPTERRPPGCTSACSKIPPGSRPKSARLRAANRQTSYGNYCAIG